MLRTDLFKTVERAETRFIAIRDTLTKPDPEIDAKVMDTIHCRQGRLGIGYQFLLKINGTIQLGRDLKTCGSHSKNLDRISVGIGVVGGTDDKGDRAFTRTPEQEEALADLLSVMREFYPDAEVDDRPTG